MRETLFTMPPAKIVSGGQTGADRAALDWAIFHDIPHGGWCPKGRKPEDGILSAQYQLTETPSATYLGLSKNAVINTEVSTAESINPPRRSGF